MGREYRVRPNEEVRLGAYRVTNRTANSIMVRFTDEGSLEVLDCCLEEQGR